MTECLETVRDFSILASLAITPYVPAPEDEVDEPESSVAQCIEDDDDPHRLARVNLDTYAAATDGAAIRYWREEWYTWKPSRACYRKIDSSELRAKMMASVKDEFNRLWQDDMERYEEKTKAADYDWDSDKGPPKVRKVTRHLITNVLEATASITCLPFSVEPMTWIGGDSDGRPTRERRNYVALKNGILDIDLLLSGADESECFLTHSKDWFSMIRLPYDFDHKAECPRFMEFLNHNLEGDEQRISILQEWAGYSLLPDTGMQRFLALEGEGANGKSVFCAALSAMVGVENCSSIPLERLGERFDRTETLGKLINISADVGEVDRVAEGMLKSFVSGDVIFFDRKGIKGLNCIPTARLVLAWNNRPRIADRSNGIWRRMILIPWQVQIAEGSRTPNMDKTWWWERSGELPGIFRWALIGLARLREKGVFSKSKVSDLAMHEYQTESNPAREFLGEYLQPSNSEIRCSLLYHFYSKWCASTGHNKPLSDRIFGRELKRVFPKCERKKVREGDALKWSYSGISFQVDELLGEKTHDSQLF